MITPTTAKITKYFVKSRRYNSKVFEITSPRLSSRLIPCSGCVVISFQTDMLCHRTNIKEGNEIQSSQLSMRVARTNQTRYFSLREPFLAKRAICSFQFLG